MNLREMLTEIRISPVRQSAKHRIVHAIKMEAFREISLKQSENPEVRVPTRSSRFWELLQGDRKLL